MSRASKLAALCLILCGFGLGGWSIAPARGENFPAVASLPAQRELPDPLMMLNGERIKNREEWFTKRRPELKALFEHYMYGQAPPAPTDIKFTVERVDPKFFGGKATKKEVTIKFGPAAAPALHLLVVVPNNRKGPAPVFVGPNFSGNHTAVTDKSVALPEVWVPDNAGAVDHKATDAGRGVQVDVWNIEKVIDRGYALATFYCGDIDPDKPDWTDGVHPHYFKPGQTKPGPHEWGTIAAWAWGVSRAVDYLVTDKDLDREHIAAVGHSRLGKTVLLAAAMDERIALVIPLQAGCGGTAPSRGKIGEPVNRINSAFPHWFNDTFKEFNEQVERIPFDQNCLVAMVAPRPVLFANAIEDSWANPAGQFEVLKAAEPVYKLLGAGSLATESMPEPLKLVDSTLGYYIRPGKHSMTTGDWEVFLNFADKQWRKGN